MSDTKRGAFMCLSINDFFSKYLSMIDGDLGDNYQIIIASKEIITDTVVKEGYKSLYISRYENIDFTPELFPSEDVLEYLYGSSRNVFYDKYLDQLNRTNVSKTLCSIADLIANDGTMVYLLASPVDIRTEFIDILKEYFYNSFGIMAYDLEEYMENPDIIYQNDMDEAKTMIQFQINNLKLINERIGVFFNKFTKDMGEAYRKILENKTIDELYVIGTNRGLHINRYKPKQAIVDHIVESFMEDDELPFRPNE